MSRNGRRVCTAEQAHARRARRGFTIVEVVVAIFILTAGLLALAGTSAAVVRMVGGAGQQALAAAAAQTRFELLRSTGSCSSIASGSATSRGISESWTATAVTGGFDVALTVSYTTPTGSRSRNYRSLIAC
ncbi:MAG: hypothetical protein NVS9B3_00780 [Gemmatimonadaceae bacterium]